MVEFIKNLSIKWKILVSAFVIFFFTIFASDGIFLYTIYKTLNYRNSLKNEKLVKITVKPLAQLLYLRRIKFAKDYLICVYKHKTIGQYRNIKGLSLYDLKGQPIFNCGTIYDKNSRNNGLYYKKLSYNGEKLGTLLIRFNLESELNGVRTRVFWVGIRFLIIAVGFIALGLFMFYMITVFLTKPLSEIKENIEKIKNGHYKITFKSRPKDEIGSVINAINSMAQATEAYIKKIDLMNKEKNELNCMAVMGEMSAHIAHEVKNTVYVISSANTYISNETHNKIVIELTNIIDNEVKRLNKMTMDFLGFTRQRSPELTAVNINKLINESLRISKLELSNLNIKLIKDLCDDNIAFINGDPELLKQVILNLIVNAIDAIYIVDQPKNKVIKICTKIKGDFVSIEVENSGQQISKENLNNIFKPFFTTKNTGSGLGLSISQRIVKLHHGTIYVDSDENKTVFTITIPLLRRAQHADGV